MILAEKLLGLDLATPAMTLLLVMLHTGTMFAVIVYFRRDWRCTYFGSREALIANGKSIALATVVTGVLGLGLLKLIEHVFAKYSSKLEVEQLPSSARMN